MKTEQEILHDIRDYSKSYKIRINELMMTCHKNNINQEVVNLLDNEKNDMELFIDRIGRMIENKDAKEAINKMTVKELIEEINGNIDDHMFTFSKIEDIDNEEYWDGLGKYLGGYKLAKLVSESSKIDNAKWVIYDSEVSAITYFATKEDIIEYFGIENIIDNYINEQ